MNPPGPTFEDLVRGLDDPDRYARCRAARELGEGGDPRAVEPLREALRDPAADVRARAAAALGRLRDERAIDPLLAALGDAKVSVRTAASAALKKFGKRAYRPLLDACRVASGDLRTDLLVTLAHHRTAEVFALLLDAYRGASGPARSVYLDALARFKTPAASEFLIAALDDPDDGIHSQVVFLLARRRDRRAVEPLLERLAAANAALARTLRAQDAAIREVSADDPASLERLREGMDASSGLMVRLDAYIRALGTIGDPRAFEPLRELLEYDGARVPPGLTMEVVRALRTIDNPRAVDHLHDLLDDLPRPERERLAMTVAGMDLMGATQSLVKRAPIGEFGALRQGLRAILRTHPQFRSQGADAGGDPTDEAERSRIGTDLLRRLEVILREFGRGEPPT